ncbi:acid protease [Coprinopsis marcescibilis]|uniref:Acid protease n=1 Tax=Coprinopsis marcescibilis TaxID=230819 RepID=A0A5C3KR11_COPMA|nr:acid protease [Coprinopsis marcescibilis]
MIPQFTLWILLCTSLPLALARPTFNSLSGFKASVHSRSMRQKPPLHTTPGIPIFDSVFAKEELHTLLSKYEQAARALAGVGLNPDQDILHAFPLNNNLYPHSEKSSVATDDVGLIPPILAETTAMMELRDYVDGALDVLYYGPLEFGTPPQRLTVDIDTGSADLWIPGDECQECTNRLFIPSKSATFNRTTNESFQISYGSGDVSGTISTDVVAIQGLKIEDQSFGLITRQSVDFNDYPNDGLMGLAFGTISQTNKPTFFENLIRRKHLALPLFSVHLTRNQERGSEVCFGCYDGSKAIGSISWIPVVSKTYWTVSLDRISVNTEGNSVETHLIAAIDTGTTLIYVPDDIAIRFYKLVSSRQKPYSGLNRRTRYPAPSQLLNTEQASQPMTATLSTVCDVYVQDSTHILVLRL